MEILEKDYEKLCQIARCLSDEEQEDEIYTFQELYENIIDIINNIK